jgi:WD40 repeat protein
MDKKNIHILEPIIYDNKAKVLDMKFNPVRDEISLCDISGKLKILKINEEDKTIEKIKNFKISEATLSSLDYSNDGNEIVLSTFDGNIIVINDGKIKRREKAHEKTINNVKYLGETTQIIASGDIEGNLKLFDSRVKKEIFSFKEQEEDITDIEFEEKHKMILSTSIDGTLCVYDIRKEGKYKLYALSDCIEDELYCMRLVKNSQKVACGTSEGPIVLFNWDWFGDFKDRIIGHPGSVNCFEKLNENFLITGCEDGLIRFVSISPKYIHTMIGDQVKKNFKNLHFNDINLLSLDKNKKFLAASSHIDCVKFYDISNIQFEVNQNDMDEIQEDDEVKSDSEQEKDEEEEYEEESEFSQDNLEEKNMNNIERESEASEDDQSFSSDNSDKKRKSKKTDTSLKLSKNKKSDFLIKKEIRKDFFSDM